MNFFFNSLFHNNVLWVTLLGWAVAQITKVGLGILRNKRFDFRWFIGTGGMPSAHAAGAGALATISGLKFGFDSFLFALAAVFALVTMFDAQGVRRATGKQAVILNKIMDDIYWRRKLEEAKLKELIGHTPIEVITGAVIGILIAIICWR